MTNDSTKKAAQMDSLNKKTHLNYITQLSLKGLVTKLDIEYTRGLWLQVQKGDKQGYYSGAPVKAIHDAYLYWLGVLEDGKNNENV